MLKKRFTLHIQKGKGHNSKYEDAEPTQHRYSTSAAASASPGGRVKKTQKIRVTKRFNATFMIKPRSQLRSAQRSKGYPDRS